jgi:hypothetical protein
MDQWLQHNYQMIQSVSKPNILYAGMVIYHNLSIFHLGKVLQIRKIWGIVYIIYIYIECLAILKLNSLFPS